MRFPYGHEQKGPYDLTILPDLAERWEYTDDKTVVFYLRKGVKFHNKPPVNKREVAEVLACLQGAGRGV